MFNNKLNFNILFILLLIFYFPFFSIFTHSTKEGFLFNINSWVNILSINFSLIIIIKHKYYFYFYKKVLFLIFVLYLTYVLNYTLTQYSSFKWLLNSFGFIFIFYAVVCTILNSDNIFNNIFFKYSKLTILLILSTLIILFIITYLLKTSEIYYNFQKNYFNGIIHQLTIIFNISKQKLGLLLNILVIWHISFWEKICFRNKIFFFIFLCIGFPFFIGIRTSLLTIILILLFLYTIKIKFLLLFLFLIISVFITLNYNLLYSLIKSNYDRLPSLLFSFSFLKSNIFGIGNGGYHIYVSEMQDILTYRFSTNTKSFWLAPESDLVYFISSFGILSSIFFLLYIYLIINCMKIFKFNSLVFTIRFFMLLSISIIFSGISQDFAANLIWWVLLALGFGVIFNCKKTLPSNN